MQPSNLVSLDAYRKPVKSKAVVVRSQAPEMQHVDMLCITTLVEDCRQILEDAAPAVFEDPELVRKEMTRLINAKLGAFAREIENQVNALVASITL